VTTTSIRDRAATYAVHAISTLQQAAARAASRIEAVEVPVATLADAGRQLNAVAYECAGRMLDQGTKSLQGLLEDGAERLRLAGEAGNLAGLYRAQLERLPASRERIARNAQATLKIAADTGRELQSIALTTYAHLVRTSRPAAKRHAPARARKTARKTRARRAA
jgi:hypothetical protein